MLEKLEKLLDLMIAYYEREMAYIPDRVTLEEIRPELKPLPVRKTRAPKPVVAAAVPMPEPAGDPFGPPRPLEELVTDKPSVEDQQEVALRCKDLVTAFIQKHMKDNPSGNEQAQALCKKTLGKLKLFKDMTFEDNAKLIPVFEKALGY